MSYRDTGYRSPSGGGASPGSGSGFTPGALLIGAADGSLGEDPTVLFWDITNERLGIGTNAPGSLLHVTGSISPVANANAYLVQTGGTLVEAGSGTHAVMAGLACLAPTLTAGAAATTDAATVYVAGAPTGGTNNHGIYTLGKVTLGNNVALVAKTTGGVDVPIAFIDAGNICWIGSSSGSVNGTRIMGGGQVTIWDSNFRCVGEVEIDGAFNHDGTTFGALNATPAAQRAHLADPAADAGALATWAAAVNVSFETFGFHAVA